MRLFPIYKDEFWLNDKWWPFAQWGHPSQSRIFFNQDEINAIKPHVSPGDYVLDIGAYTGDSAFPFLVNGCRVFAMEPNPASFEVLTANAVLWNRNLVPVNQALMPIEGKYAFHYSDENLCNGGYRTPGHRFPIEIEAISPTKLPSRNWKFIKIDAETQDLPILICLEETIREHKPVVQCEVYFSLPVADRVAFARQIERMGYVAVGRENDLESFLAHTKGGGCNLTLIPK